MILPPPVPYPTALEFIPGPHEQHLREITLIRGKMRTCVKRAKKAGIDGDWSNCAQVITEYLPQLYAMIHCIEGDDLLWINEGKWTWRSNLANSTLLRSSKASTSMRSIYFELLSTLLCQAICLSNKAAIRVEQLGSFEVKPLSLQDRSRNDEIINESADTLCTAAGILYYCSTVVLPKIDASLGHQERSKVPVEFTKDGILALSKVFLAEANLLAIRKLLSKFKSLSRDTTTPGPPLAKSHPSPSLCAKLYLNVTSLIGEAKVLSKSDFIQPFRKYLDDLEKFTEAMGYKWLGIDIGENGSIEKFGSSIAFLKLAAKALEKLRTNKKSGSQARIEEEIDSVGAFKSGYEKLNSTLHFQTIPSASSLAPLIPTGRAALSMKNYILPSATFQASSRDYISNSMERLNVDSSDEEEEGSVGQGSYY